MSNSPQRFRRKSTVIEAVQWFPGVNHPGVESDIERLKDPRWHEGEYGDASLNPDFVITAHGQRVYLTPGDWIIPEAKEGCYYPCKPDVFAATYDREAILSPSDRRIKRLMQSCGLPDSLSLYQVFKQLENELHHEIADEKHMADSIERQARAIINNAAEFGSTTELGEWIDGMELTLKRLDQQREDKS